MALTKASSYGAPLVKTQSSVFFWDVHSAHITCTKSPLYDQCNLNNARKLKFPEYVTLFVCWLRSPLQIYSGFNVPPQLYIVQGGCEFWLGKLLNKALPRIQIDDVEAFGATVPVRPLIYERNTAWHSIAMHCGGSDKILAIDPAEKCIDCWSNFILLDVFYDYGGETT